MFLVLLGSLASVKSVGFQSESCTKEELAAGKQCFRRIPDASYSLPRGYTVILHCIVENMHGKAQWRFNNLLLGGFFPQHCWQETFILHELISNLKCKNVIHFKNFHSPLAV